jgi:hypothetical protein
VLQAFPSEYDTAIRQAQIATKAALADGHKLLEVSILQIVKTAEKARSPSSTLNKSEGPEGAHSRAAADQQAQGHPRAKDQVKRGSSISTSSSNSNSSSNSSSSCRWPAIPMPPQQPLLHPSQLIAPPPAAAATPCRSSSLLLAYKQHRATATARMR